MNIKVLIVDDEPTILALLTRILSKDSIFEVDTAENGYDAIAMATRTEYNALVCDIDLPDIDGTEVVKELKMKKRCPNLIVYISGAVKTAPRNMEGNMVFIRKPFNPGEIMTILLRARR